MSARTSFDALQNRWAAGDPLSADEEAARQRLAREDPLAEREMAVFEALSQRLATSDGDDAPNVAAALARARGVRLRVVASGENDGHGAARVRRRARAATFGAVLAAAAAVGIGRWRTESPAPRATSNPRVPAPRATATPAPELPTTPRSELTFVSGEVSSNGRPATVGANTLVRGARVTTREGQACLKIDPAIDVCLGAASELVLEGLAGSDVRVRVTSGTAVAALAPRSGGQTFSLVAGELRATAHGTVFALEAAAGRPGRVTVLEGTVAVDEPDAPTTLVGAHAALDVAPGRPRERGAVGRAEEARLLAWLGPRELARETSLGVLAIAQHGDARALVDGAGPFELPLRTLLDAGRHRVTLRGGAGPGTVLETDIEAGRVRTLEARAADTNTPPSAGTLLEQARDRLARGDARGARLLYERLRAAHPASPEAHTVLVSLGKLELQTGAAERALASFDTYAKQGGPLLPEAFSGRIKALRALGRQADERQAIHAFLARYPKSFEAAALEQRLRALGQP